jgi:acetamidase/formamidase
MRRIYVIICFVGWLKAPGETYTIYANAKQYSHVFSSQKPVLLRIKSGDTVITRTVDSSGRDYTGTFLSETGNPLTGPFYIEGAMPGDSIAVHLDKVRLNRNWGYSGYRISPAIFPAGTAETLYKGDFQKDAVLAGRSDLLPWDIDLQRQLVNPRVPKGSLKFNLPAKPMLGCIGVATPGESVLTSGPAGPHGGNMDFNEVAEGATVFLPVFQPGAYFYLGDGHALQGDGEGLGSGVETSMDVQFTVTLLKGKPLSTPRLVNDEYLISIGAQPEFTSSMDQGLRIANADMFQWLTTEYGLTQPEAGLLMGTVVQHKIVTYFGSVATLIPRKCLSNPKYGQ